jgi:hypothetical protein
MEIHELEKHRNWPVIVTAIPCPVCASEAGHLCVEVKTGVTRIDYHAQRKQLAADAWNKKEVASATEDDSFRPSPETSGGSRPEEVAGTEEDLEAMSKGELYHLIEDLGLTEEVTTKTTKAELIELIEDARKRNQQAS